MKQATPHQLLDLLRGFAQERGACSAHRLLGQRHGLGGALRLLRTEGIKCKCTSSKLLSPSRHLLWWALGAFLVGLLFLVAFAGAYAQCKASAPSSPPGKDEESSICFPAYFSSLGTFMIIAFVATFFLLALAAHRARGAAAIPAHVVPIHTAVRVARVATAPREDDV